MANEAICLEAPTRFTRRTCADGTTIPKGTILALTSPNTVAASTADNDVWGGIAWMEKLANDGSTEIVAALDGVWSVLTTAAGITVGNDVTVGGANQIKIYTTLDDEKGLVGGKAMETCAGAVQLKMRQNCLA